MFYEFCVFVLWGLFVLVMTTSLWLAFAQRRTCLWVSVVPTLDCVWRSHFLLQFPLRAEDPGRILKYSVKSTYSALIEFYTTKCWLFSGFLCCFVKEEAAEYIYAFIVYVWQTNFIMSQWSLRMQTIVLGWIMMADYLNNHPATNRLFIMVDKFI